MPDFARTLSVALMFGAAVCCPSARPAQPFPPPLPGKVPSFKIEAVSFKALDETGYDWPGSDEIRVGFVTPFEDITSREFGDVDAGETFKFNADESCVVPVGQATGRQLGRLVGPPSNWFCADLGRPGPLSFELVMAEQDIDLFGFEFPPVSSGRTDDLIGRKTLTLMPEELLAAMPSVGDTVEENVLLGPCVAPFVCPPGSSSSRAQPISSNTASHPHAQHIPAIRPRPAISSVSQPAPAA